MIPLIQTAVRLARPAGPLAAGFGLVFVCQTVLFVRGNPEAGMQPIAFNHAKHLAAGLECSQCHTGTQTSEHAGLPPLETCMGCHEAALTQSHEEARLRSFAAAGREIPWRPVTRVPSHVYFSHRRHVALGKITCAVCHGAMENVTAPPHAPLRAITMESCIQCHQKNQARTDCNDCHR